MRTVEKLNLLNPEHSAFAYDLAMACQNEFIDDYNPDIILLLEEFSHRLKEGDTKAFLCKVDGQKAGIIWVEIDRYEIGFLRGGMMPAYRNGFHIWWFFKEFIEYCFQGLKLRKLQADVPVWNRRIEKLVRLIGFKKEGIIFEASMKNGVPENHVYFGLTRNRYEGKRHVQRQQRRRKQQLVSA
jgi:hypothetical protein